MAQVRIRLTGTPPDVEAAAILARECYIVLEESDDKPRRNQSMLVDRYLVVAVPDPPGPSLPLFPAEPDED